MFVYTSFLEHVQHQGDGRWLIARFIGGILKNPQRAEYRLSTKTPNVCHYSVTLLTATHSILKENSEMQ